MLKPGSIWRASGGAHGAESSIWPRILTDIFDEGRDPRVHFFQKRGQPPWTGTEFQFSSNAHPMLIQWSFNALRVLLKYSFETFWMFFEYFSRDFWNICNIHSIPIKFSFNAHSMLIQCSSNEHSMLFEHSFDDDLRNFFHNHSIRKKHEVQKPSVHHI